MHAQLQPLSEVDWNAQQAIPGSGVSQTTTKGMASHSFMARGTTPIYNIKNITKILLISA